MWTCESTIGATLAAYPGRGRVKIGAVLQSQTLERVIAPLTPDQIRQRYLLAEVPRVPLATLPTPLHDAPRLARELGIGRLLIKRDDLTGLAFGGNKARNLEFRMAEAVQQGADVFIAGLEAQSNSARMSTAAANLLGMQTSHLYMASGNKGHAGLIVGRKLLGRAYRTIAISQHYADDRVSGALEGARQALALLGWQMDLDESDVESYDEYVETAYGEPSPRGLAAMQLAARTEGLILDPIYTAKAMAGLVDHARRGLLGSQDTVVFIHTGGRPPPFT